MTYRRVYNFSRSFGPFFDDTFYPPPPAASFSSIAGTGTSSATDIAAGVVFESSKVAGTGRTAFLVNAPSPPYTLKVNIIPLAVTDFVSGGDSLWGVCFATSSNQIFELINIRKNNAIGAGGVNFLGQSTLHYARLNSTLSYNSGWSYETTNQAVYGAPYLWMSLRDPGTGNLQAGIGQNANSISTFDMEDRSIFGTPPTKIGIIMQNATSTNINMRVLLQSWQITNV